MFIYACIFYLFIYSIYPSIYLCIEYSVISISIFIVFIYSEKHKDYLIQKDRTYRFDHLYRCTMENILRAQHKCDSPCNRKHRQYILYCKL